MKFLPQRPSSSSTGTTVGRAFRSARRWFATVAAERVVARTGGFSGPIKPEQLAASRRLELVDATRVLRR